MIRFRGEIYIILLLFMSRRVCFYEGGEVHRNKRSLSIEAYVIKARHFLHKRKVKQISHEIIVFELSNMKYVMILLGNVKVDEMKYVDEN